MTIIITRESLRAAAACYDVDRIDELVPPEGIAVTRANVDKMRAAGVPNDDIHWALCRAAGDHPREHREHACWCARRALESERVAGREPDSRSWAAVDVADQFARGEVSLKELAAAMDAAMGAAMDAMDAAGAAARAAARAAMDAAMDAMDAAGDAWAAQVNDLVARLEKCT
jgi:hypothetical protein